MIKRNNYKHSKPDLIDRNVKLVICVVAFAIVFLSLGQGSDVAGGFWRAVGTSIELVFSFEVWTAGWDQLQTDAWTFLARFPLEAVLVFGVIVFQTCRNLCNLNSKVTDVNTGGGGPEGGGGPGGGRIVALVIVLISLFVLSAVAFISFLPNPPKWTSVMVGYIFIMIMTTGITGFHLWREKDCHTAQEIKKLDLLRAIIAAGISIRVIIAIPGITGLEKITNLSHWLALSAVVGLGFVTSLRTAKALAEARGWHTK